LQTTWAEESTPWGYVQFMVLVMGLFHLKITCDIPARTFPEVVDLQDSPFSRCS